MTRKGVILMNNSTTLDDSHEDISADYPMGALWEPYDIWRDFQILEESRQMLYKKKTSTQKRMNV